MKSSEDRKREILRLYEEHIISILEDKPVEETLKIGLTRAKALSALNALDKPSRLTKNEFRHILSEFPPSIAEDSGQPEWTQGEMDKVWDFITGKKKFIEYDRWERKPRIDEGKLEKVIEVYWFLALFVPFMGIDWLRKKIAHIIAQKAEEIIK